MNRGMALIALLAMCHGIAGCDQDTDWPGPDATADTTVDTVEDALTDTVVEDTGTSDPVEEDPVEDPVEEEVVTTLDPPSGESSGGSGGAAASGSVRVTSTGGVTYRIIAPGTTGPQQFMIVYSGTEGGQNMVNNILSVMDYCGIGDFIFAVIDGVDYWEDGQAGAYVLDAVRAQYDVDNDRTFLLSESAGTRAGLQLGLDLRQSYFAAYWANDVNASGTPTLTASDLGFAPYGNAGPGGDFPDATAIVNGMIAAGYRCPAPAPYDGPGSGSHGSTEQFLAAFQWFAGKSRL